MLDLNKIYLQDCLEGIRAMSDKSVELVHTDPPYGIRVNWSMAKVAGLQPGKSKAKKGNYENLDWDKKIPSEEIFKEIFRVSKNQVIWGGNYFVEFLRNSQCWLVWDKDNNDNNFADCELAWTSFKTSVRKFKFTWNGMLQEHMGKHKQKRYHPTQKPVQLGTWVLEKYSKPGDLILDPFAGSGSFLVAAQEMGRNFIGFEKEQKYVDICNQRLSQQVLITP